LIPEQHFTQPPPRYTEATLIRALEEYGIGRPSTYAPIMATIQQRGYVRREGKRLVPTETGFLVNDLLVEHFPEVMGLRVHRANGGANWTKLPPVGGSGCRWCGNSTVLSLFRSPRPTSG
jgi:hypothetical protein